MREADDGKGKRRQGSLKRGRRKNKRKKKQKMRRMRKKKERTRNKRNTMITMIRLEEALNEVHRLGTGTCTLRARILMEVYAECV